MHEVFVGGRSVTVTHIKTEPTEYGDIQRYRLDVSGFDAPTRIAILRTSSTVDARVLAIAVDSELLLGYEGSEESGLLRDPALRHGATSTLMRSKSCSSSFTVRRPLSRPSP